MSEKVVLYRKLPDGPGRPEPTEWSFVPEAYRQEIEASPFCEVATFTRNPDPDSDAVVVSLWRPYAERHVRLNQVSIHDATVHVIQQIQDALNRTEDS